MSRPIRFIPATGALVEVTDRTLHSRFLLSPGPELNEIIIGALARAKSLYPVKICAFAFASNHFHLLLEVPDAWHLSAFMGHFNSKIAHETRSSHTAASLWPRPVNPTTMGRMAAATMTGFIRRSHAARRGSSSAGGTAPVSVPVTGWAWTGDARPRQ
jgi:REP element-mobilizing transposase RayT